MSNDPELAARTSHAGEALFNGICTAISDERGVHLETAIAAASYLAGSAILRNTGIDLTKFPTGSPILVDKVNEIGPIVLDMIMQLCARGGAPGGAADVVPPDHAPLKSFDDLMRATQPVFDTICREQQIPAEMQPFVAARAIVQFILAGKAQLDPSISKAIAAEAIVRGAKTVPPTS